MQNPGKKDGKTDNTILKPSCVIDFKENIGTMDFSDIYRIRPNYQ